jgi:hypothetical protein
MSYLAPCAQLDRSERDGINTGEDHKSKKIVLVLHRAIVLVSKYRCRGSELSEGFSEFLESQEDPGQPSSWELQKDSIAPKHYDLRKQRTLTQRHYVSTDYYSISIIWRVPPFG